MSEESQSAIQLNKSCGSLQTNSIIQRSVEGAALLEYEDKRVV